MASLKRMIEKQPKRFTEECALISVFLNMTGLKDNWFLNYISPPGGAWQEAYVKDGDNTYRFYVGKTVKRPDLALQKSTQKAEILFFIAESKESFESIIRNREKIKESMETFYKFLKEVKIDGRRIFEGKIINPVFNFVVALDVRDLGEFEERVIKNKLQLIEDSIDDLDDFEGGVACIAAFWKSRKTKFNIIYSSNFSKERKHLLDNIFVD